MHVGGRKKGTWQLLDSCCIDSRRQSFCFCVSSFTSASEESRCLVGMSYAVTPAYFREEGEEGSRQGHPAIHGYHTCNSPTGLTQGQEGISQNSGLCLRWEERERSPGTRGQNLLAGSGGRQIFTFHRQGILPPSFPEDNVTASGTSSGASFPPCPDSMFLSVKSRMMWITSSRITSRAGLFSTQGQDYKTFSKR